MTTESNGTKTRVRRPLTGDAAKLNVRLSLALLLSGIGTRESLAKAAGVSPLTISASIKRGRMYRGIADSIRPLLTLNSDLVEKITKAIEDNSGYCLISDFVSEAPSGSGFNKALFERVTALKATFNAVCKLNKFSSISDFTDKTGFDISFLDTGFITPDIMDSITSIVLPKGKSLQYLGALDDFVGTPETEESDEDEESEDSEDL
jgi:hypothetical protein